MKNNLSLIITTLILTLLAIPSFAQDCKPPEVIFNKNAENIFTEEQEMYLGEAMALQFQKDYRVIEDEAVNSYVRKIGERVIKHLPPTEIKFKFHVVDLPAVNAFITPGGNVYITRKLIAFVKNEDELAGVIAHELGHGIVHHGAIDMSKYFKKILDIEKVGDRQDIFDKYNKFIENQNTKRIRQKRSHVGDQQLEADKIGVFAMNSAGYDPAAFTSAFDRLAQTEGKTGSWFSDLFGATSAGEKRLREIVNALKQIPATCIDKNAESNAAFEEWRNVVITFSDYARAEKVSGLMRKKTLSPGLRDNINHLEFSPDGKYLIAQDDSSIFVLQREPFKFLFRIDSSEANNASFTADSKYIVFNTPTLRVERWDVAKQKPDLVREIFLTDGCFQTAISKDGNTFVCFSFDNSADRTYVDAKIMDVQTNSVILEKKEFFRPHYYDFLRYLLFSSVDDETKMFQTEFSPDGRYLVVGRVFKNEARTQYITGAGGRGIIREANAGKSGTLGFDLLRKEEIEIGEKLRDIIVSPFTFLSNNRIIGQNREDEEDSGVFSFPSGKQLDKFLIKGNSFTRPHKGDYVLVRPLKTAAVGVYDLQNKKVVIGNKTSAFDVYDDVFVSENVAGELGLYSLKDDKQLGMIELPESRFGNIRTLSVSHDLNWLAISDKDRGAVWSTYSGSRFFYVQGFRGAFFDAGGKIYADFARTPQTKRQIALLDITSKGFVSSSELDIPAASQYGKYLVSVRSNGNDKKKKDNKNSINLGPLKIDGPPSGNTSGFVSEDGTLEVRDVRTQKLLWSKDFPDEMPRRFVNDADQTFTFVWPLKSDAAKSAIKEDENLKTLAKNMGDKDGDYFVQSVDAETGKLIAQTLIETGEGSFRIRNAETAGDWLAIADSENRVLFYSLKDGELKQRFFGNNFAINKEGNIVGIGNLSGQLIVYDLETGRNIEQMAFDSPIAYAQFGKYGKKLLVLTTKQDVFVMDTTKFGQDSKLATK